MHLIFQKRKTHTNLFSTFNFSKKKTQQKETPFQR